MYAIDFDVVGFNIADSGYLAGIKKWVDENELQELELFIEDLDNMIFYSEDSKYDKQTSEGFYLLTEQEQDFVKWAQKLINEGSLTFETAYSGDGEMPLWVEYKKEQRRKKYPNKKEQYKKLMELEAELQELVDSAPDNVKKFLLGKDLITEIHTTS